MLHDLNNCFLQIEIIKNVYMNIPVDTLRLDVKNDKSAIIDVKNKLKKKSGVINNKGPMKAVHPVSTIQRKGKSANKIIT